MPKARREGRNKRTGGGLGRPQVAKNAVVQQGVDNKTQADEKQQRKSVVQRRMERREAFQEKLKLSHERKEKTRKAGPALGEVGNLAQALLAYEQAWEAEEQGGAVNKKKKQEQQPTNVDSSNKNAKKKGKNKLGAKKLKKIQLQEVSLFQQVLAHPAVKQDTFGAIREHLQNEMERKKREEEVEAL